MTTLSISILVLIFSVALSFFYGLITRNYSTVDRLWSILPFVYMLIWLPGNSHNPRFIITIMLIFLWCVRLTTNFALKGGYKFSFKQGFTGEDYRWAYLREKIRNRLLFELFNLFFISGFQLGLIFLFTLPLYYYGNIEGRPGGLEWFLYAVHVFLLALETVSDIQQFRFYRRRNELPWSGRKRYQLGFNTFGLWKYSRHPNYVCEFSQWVVVSLYLIAVTGKAHYSGAGAVILIMLFIGSTVMAESITSSKYRAYKAWKRMTSVWFPVKSIFRWKQKKEFLEE